jgi:hypothetical protein
MNVKPSFPRRESQDTQGTHDCLRPLCDSQVKQDEISFQLRDPMGLGIFEPIAELSFLFSLLHSTQL